METKASVGWDSLPSELAGVILDHTSTEKHTVIPLHFVCKQWRTLLPLPTPKELWDFVPLLVEQGSLSLLQWAK